MRFLFDILLHGWWGWQTWMREVDRGYCCEHSVSVCQEADSWVTYVFWLVVFSLPLNPSLFELSSVSSDNCFLPAEVTSPPAGAVWTSQKAETLTFFFCWDGLRFWFKGFSLLQFLLTSVSGLMCWQQVPEVSVLFRDSPQVCLLQEQTTLWLFQKLLLWSQT